MSDAVLDASAVLALLQGEPGSEEIARYLPGALLSAVNLAEVVSRMTDRGLSETTIRIAVGKLNLVIVPFDWGDGWDTGLLRGSTRDLGLSLGDRACLALAFSRRIPAVTTDSAWARLRLGPAVRVVGRKA